MNMNMDMGICFTAWDYLKILPNIPVAKLPAIPPERAFEANDEAWLNLSHLENARVLVMVRIRAIAKSAFVSLPATSIGLRGGGGGV